MVDVRSRLTTATSLFMSTAFKLEWLLYVLMFKALIYSCRHLCLSWKVQLSFQLLRSTLLLDTRSDWECGFIQSSFPDSQPERPIAWCESLIVQVIYKTELAWRIHPMVFCSTAANLTKPLGSVSWG